MVRSRRLVRGWRVASEGGDALSSKPHLGCSGAVQHLIGDRIDQLGVEDASRGKGQLPHGLVIGNKGHLAEMWEEWAWLRYTRRV